MQRNKYSSDSKLGLFDNKTKKLLLRPRYDMIEEMPSTGFYIVTNEEKKGVYNIGKSKMIVPVKFDKIQGINDGIVSVSKDGTVYHYDIYGNCLK